MDTTPRTAPDRTETPAPPRGGVRAALALWPYLIAGVGFGFVAIRSEIVSWYRIQEMFRFQSFHMYGVIGSAVAVAAVALWLLRRSGVRALDGSAIALAPKAHSWPRYILGGTLFGIGWGLVGACPGPILALIGAGLPAFGVVLVGAVGGTWLYGALRSRLPH